MEVSQGKLILAGVNETIFEQLDRTETTEDLLGEEDVFIETDILGESVLTAYKSAQNWLSHLENPNNAGDSSIELEEDKKEE